MSHGPRGSAEKACSECYQLWASGESGAWGRDGFSWFTHRWAMCDVGLGEEEGHAAFLRAEHRACGKAEDRDEHETTVGRYQDT